MKTETTFIRPQPVVVLDPITFNNMDIPTVPFEREPEVYLALRTKKANPAANSVQKRASPASERARNVETRSAGITTGSGFAGITR